MRRTGIAVVVAAFVASACGGGGNPTYVSPTPRVSSPTGPTPTGGAAAPNLAGVKVTFDPVAELNTPLAMAVRAGDDRMFIASQSGLVYALEPGGTGEIPEVIDIKDRISFGGEQGLLGLVFSPDGRFLYVNYTDVDGNTNVDEYRVGSGGSIAAGNRRRVLFVQQPFSNHNGGNLIFGPDGFLYIGLGDGGSGGDPMGNGQSLKTLLGKMVRIDPRPQGGRPYGVPQDNPFVGRSGARPEIWDYGLRNPWRYSFDRETGDLWIGDVGQGEREEVDFEAAGSGGGRNYGWNAFEGTQPYQSLQGGSSPKNATAPLFDYGRENGECSVTGGYVYRGTAIPKLRGAYLYGDFCRGQVFAVVIANGKVTQRRALGPLVDSLSSFGEDQDGELYVLSLTGRVARILPA
jgi:glucose/arabinose dehydrogenase